MSSSDILHISNEEVIKKVKEGGVRSTSKWLQTFATSDASINFKSFESITQRTYEKFKVLRKNQHHNEGPERLESFLSTYISLPQHKITSSSTNKADTSCNIVALQEKLHCLDTVAKDVVLENKLLEKKLSKSETVSKLKLHRLQQVKQLKFDNVSLNTTIKSMQSRIVSKTSELKRLRLKIAYAETERAKKTNELETALEELAVTKNQLKTFKRESQATTNQLEKDVKDANEENAYLRHIINDNVITYDDKSRRFTPELQQCVYDLLNLNISFRNISPAIMSVLNLVNIKPNRLPCKATVNNMNIQRLALSQKHIADKLTPEKNTCLLSDETNKFGKKMEGIHAADERGNMWVLGVREIVTKSGKDVLKSLQEILGDIDAVSETAEKPASRQLLKNMASTMSDRASTQIKFNELLQEFRTDVLREDLGDEWENLTEEEQLSISRLCNFFCSLHALVHMAEACSKSLIEYESDAEIPVSAHAFNPGGEPGTVRLVRTVCKAFSKGGDEKNGQHLNFSTYCKDFLKENGFKCVPLERFRGNRFNILFRNAASVFLLREQLQAYLTIEHSNRLLASIYHDISTPEYMAGCKALGLISELVTVPLWCMIEDQSLHIIEATEKYQELIGYLEDLPENLDGFMEGTYLLSFVEQDKLDCSKEFASLKQEWEHDTKVKVILQILTPSLCILLSKLFKDFLPTGPWFNAPEQIKDKTLSVPKHNKFSETIFGHMDRLLREKPNTTLIAAEANMMFVHNKTSQWLRGKSDQEKEELISNARRNVKMIRTQFKERSMEIDLERRRVLEEKRVKAEAAERNRIMKRERITDSIHLWGLWQSEEEVDSGLICAKTKTNKISALKCQLTFRKKVFEQKCDKSIYRVSKKEGDKTVPLNVDELAVNVKKLVRKAYEIQCTEVPSPDDQMIVGKKVKHAVKDPHDPEESTWLIGQVISQVPGFPTWFNIKYSGDPAVYSYQLLRDLENGQLKVLI